MFLNSCHFFKKKKLIFEKGYVGEVVIMNK